MTGEREDAQETNEEYCLDEKSSIVLQPPKNVRVCLSNESSDMQSSDRVSSLIQSSSICLVFSTSPISRTPVMLFIADKKAFVHGKGN